MDLNLLLLAVLIISAFITYLSSNDDAKIKKAIDDKTDTLVAKGKETIDTLNKISKDVAIAQNQLDSTYLNSVLNLEQSVLNHQTTLENLKRTIEAKEKILKSQNDMLSRLTGGNSFPYITISHNKLQLHLDGDHGIPDLRIEIFFLNISKNKDNDIYKKYIYEGILNKDIIKFYDNTFTKLYVNKTYQDIVIPNEILESIMKNNDSGFDIRYNSGYKSWTQCIRLHKNMSDTKQIEIFNILYESKEIKVKYKEDLVKKIKIEASPNYKDLFNDFKKVKHLENFFSDYTVILYPNLELLELKEKEVDQTLSRLFVNQFKPTEKR